MSLDPWVHCTVLYCSTRWANPRGWASIRIICAIENSVLLNYANMEQLAFIALINITHLFLVLRYPPGCGQLCICLSIVSCWFYDRCMHFKTPIYSTVAVNKKQYSISCSTIVEWWENENETVGERYGQKVISVLLAGEKRSQWAQCVLW